MKKNIDKFLINASLLYLLVPLIIFLLGWIRLPIAIIGVCVLTVSYFKIYQKIKYRPLNQVPSNRFMLMILFISCVWVYISGIGGFGYQNNDLIWRNAMFRDLITYDWPVLYRYDTGKVGTLVYYVGFWMPSALVGKVFGWSIANYFLYLWSVFGVFLIFYLLCRYIGRFTYVAIFVMIFFSGLDIVGNTIMKNKFALGDHIEWWAFYFQYSSNTTLLFWVFNQAIPAFLITIIVLNVGNSSNIGYLCALGVVFCPLPLIGLIPFAIYIALCDGIENEFNFKNILKIFSLENVLSSLSVLLIFSIYYLSNISGSSQQNGIIFSIFPYEKLLILKRLIIFYTVEFLIYIVLIFSIKKEYLKNNIYIISIIALILIPIYRFGISNDFAMRVSIPSLLIVMIYTINALLKKRGLLTYILSFFLIIGSITPISEMVRFIINGKFINDPLKTLAKRNDMEDQGFILHDIENKKILKIIYKKIK